MIQFVHVVKTISEVSYPLEEIRAKIYTIRGEQVMLDSDLAAIYGYTTSRFNEQVSNNNERFQGEEFSFFLTKEEFTNLMSNKSISSWGGRSGLFA